MHPELVAAAQAAGNWLSQRGLRLVTAESCTGGLIAAAMTEIPGSSAWFDRGLVTYTNEAKQELLGVSAQTLARHGAVSEETVREMAVGALSRCTAEVAIAVSGIAGPGGGTPGKPVGTVHLAWAWQMDSKTEIVVMKRLFEGDRSEVRLQTALLALQSVTNRE